MWAERVAGGGEKLWELDKEAFYLDIKERTCPSKDTQVLWELNKEEFVWIVRSEPGYEEVSD